MTAYPVIDPVATGERIKELREANRLKVHDVSEYMGFMEPQAVYKWQRGESLPTVDNLYALSRLFGTSMEDIVREREEVNRASSFLLNRKLLILRSEERRCRSSRGWFLTSPFLFGKRGCFIDFSAYSLFFSHD